MTSHRRIKAAKGTREWYWSISIKYLTPIGKENCIELETIGSKSRFVLHWNHCIASLTEWLNSGKKVCQRRKKKTTELDHCNWSIFQDRKIYSHSWPSPITLIFSVTCVIFFIIYKEIKATYLVQASLNHSRMNHSFCSQCDMWKPAYIESSLMAFWLFCTAYVFNIYHLNTYKSFYSLS